MKRLLFFRARSLTTRFVAAAIGLLTLIGHVASGQPAGDSAEKAVARNLQDLDPTTANAAALVEQGRQIFRFDTFGDETYWGDMLNLHLTIEGASFGGVGPGLSPKGVLSAGLKIDADALPRDLLEKLSKGKVDLDDPAVTLELLKLNAVIGVTGFFTSSGTLRSVGSNARFVTLRSTTPTPRCVPVRFSRTPARAVWATASTVGPIAISTSGKSCLSPPISARLPACWASARTR